MVRVETEFQKRDRDTRSYKRDRSGRVLTGLGRPESVLHYTERASLEGTGVTVVSGEVRTVKGSVVSVRVNYL